MQSTSKTKLSCHDQSDGVPFVMKTKMHNDMTDHTSEVYVENDIELLWLIGSGANYDEH